MAFTPLTGATPYCSTTQFVELYDVRQAGDYLSDTGQRLPPPDVITSTTLLSILELASGHLESQLVRGGRYYPEDLYALTNNGAHFLRGVVAGLAAYYLWQRRPTKFARDALPAVAEMALQHVEMLGNGLEILPFEETARAGRLQHHVTTPTQVYQRGLCEVGARRYFGQRGDESGGQRNQSSY